MKRIAMIALVLLLNIDISWGVSLASATADKNGINKNQPIAIGEVVYKGEMFSENGDGAVEFSYIYTGIDGGNIFLKRKINPPNYDKGFADALRDYQENPVATLNDKENKCIQAQFLLETGKLLFVNNVACRIY